MRVVDAVKDAALVAAGHGVVPDPRDRRRAQPDPEILSNEGAPDLLLGGSEGRA